jgi:anti-sigma28 factor (negative regulator of flagellin synthesis)
MRIENLASEVNLNPKTTGRRPSSEKGVNVSERGDNVQLSSVGKLLSNRTVDNVRNSRIEAIKQRVKEGFYDRPEVREAIADAFLSSGAVEPVLAEVQEIKITQKHLPNIPDIRVDRVEEVAQKVRDGFYENSEVKNQTANQVLDSLLS